MKKKLPFLGFFLVDIIGESEVERLLGESIGNCSNIYHARAQY